MVAPTGVRTALSPTYVLVDELGVRAQEETLNFLRHAPRWSPGGNCDAVASDASGQVAETVPGEVCSTKLIELPNLHFHPRPPLDATRCEVHVNRVVEAGHVLPKITVTELGLSGVPVVVGEES